MDPVLSHVTVRPLIRARRDGAATASLSTDLGRTTVEVEVGTDGVRLPAGLTIEWPAVERIAAVKTACFLVGDRGPEPIRGYSEALDRVYTLFPTERAPTMLVSGFPMHRIKGTDPVADTEAKITALGVRAGDRILDTATGLGYTAIALAARAGRVLTIELDRTVLELAGSNPWSAALFEDGRIEQRIGDATEVVAELPVASFDRILHDPPMISLAGDLYGAAFYGELARVLRPGGRLFHYVGNPGSPSGARTTRGVVGRLHEAGFRDVRSRPESFGIVARRGR